VAARRDILLIIFAVLLCAGTVQAQGHLRVSGTSFITPDGIRFEWRGISAFRLAQFVAHHRESEADAYLRWAALKRLNVVRVLMMADGLFKLSPDEGVRALPKLLDLARKHGLYVEVVALADTEAIDVDVEAHVRAVATICARYPNALLELANEPAHPTQAQPLHDPRYLQKLAVLVPAGVPVALGSAEYGDGFAAGTYVTWHAPRTDDWPAQISKGAELLRKYRKPVVNDEPIGAADRTIRGRRDSVPMHFRTAGEATRRAGLSGTFHYEGGLQARMPTKIEEACLDAWLAGLTGTQQN
jgi:hypothetical protein